MPCYAQDEATSKTTYPKLMGMDGARKEARRQVASNYKYQYEYYCCKCKIQGTLAPIG